MEFEPKQAPRAEVEAPKEAEIEVAEAFDRLTRAVSKLELRSEERLEIEKALLLLFELLGGRCDWQ